MTPSKNRTFCDAKQTHATRSAAKAAVRCACKRCGDTACLDVYRCPLCKGWHMVRTKNMRNGELGREKFCSRCKEWWPADLEFFYANPGKVADLSDWCKACYREHRNANDAAASRPAGR